MEIQPIKTEQDYEAALPGYDAARASRPGDPSGRAAPVAVRGNLKEALGLWPRARRSGKRRSAGGEAWWIDAADQDVAGCVNLDFSEWDVCNVCQGVAIGQEMHG